MTDSRGKQFILTPHSRSRKVEQQRENGGFKKYRLSSPPPRLPPSLLPSSFYSNVWKEMAASLGVQASNETELTENFEKASGSNSLKTNTNCEVQRPGTKFSVLLMPRESQDFLQGRKRRFICLPWKESWIWSQQIKVKGEASHLTSSSPSIR